LRRLSHEISTSRRCARFDAYGIRDGIKIKVITDGKDIITAFPIK